MAPRSKDLGRAIVVSPAPAPDEAETVSVATVFCSLSVCATAASVPRSTVSKVLLQNIFCLFRFCLFLRMDFRKLASLCRIGPGVNRGKNPRTSAGALCGATSEIECAQRCGYVFRARCPNSLGLGFCFRLPL